MQNSELLKAKTTQAFVTLPDIAQFINEANLPLASVESHNKCGFYQQQIQKLEKGNFLLSNKRNKTCGVHEEIKSVQMQVLTFTNYMEVIV